MRRLASAAILFAAGCLGARDPGMVESDIIGGTNDGADPAVVVLYTTVPGQPGGSLCTAEIVSPHVLLTAAHCTGGNPATATNSVYHVYLGADFSQATAQDLLPVKEVHHHPSFDINNLAGGNDVGVVIVDGALPSSIAPLRINHTALVASDNGRPARLVGYGMDNGSAQTGAGVKRQTTTTLTSHTDLLLRFADPTHETCNGDSGGPALMALDGVEVIAGLTSYGDAGCTDGGWDTRVDAFAAWINPWIASADPGFAGMPPSPSGGTQAPPTSSATPMPPSSGGAGGVGESCVQGSCGSQGGCAVGGDGASGLVALAVGLGITLARARRRSRR